MPRRRSEGAPLNLFSFQDIVMSVSGVIIFVVLLMGVELSQVEPGKPGGPANPDRSQELSAMEGKSKGLRAQVTELSQQGPPQRERPRTDDLVELVKANIGIDQQTSDLKAQTDRDAMEVKALQADLAELNAKAGILNRQVDIKMKEIEHIIMEPDQVEPDTTVYLVECSGTRIRLGKLGSREALKSYGTQVADQADFRKHVTGLATGRNCLVFMIKPSASGYAMDLALRTREESGLAVGYDALEEAHSIPWR
jgi:chaperonin cofactor prefoldin